MAPLPTWAPAAGAPAAASAARPTAEASASKRLIVGQGLSLSGDITACDLLIVEGSVQVTLNETKAIEITETGRFTNGKAAVGEATISGVYEGELTVRGRLLVRGTGRVNGTIRYGELEVERGGRLSGTIELLPRKVISLPVRFVEADDEWKALHLASRDGSAGRLLPSREVSRRLRALVN